MEPKLRTSVTRRDLLVLGLLFAAAALFMAPWTVGKQNEWRASRLLAKAIGIPSAALLPQHGPQMLRTSEPALAQVISLANRALRWYPHLKGARQILAQAYLLAGDEGKAKAALLAMGQYPAYGQVQQAERMMLYASYALFSEDPPVQAQVWREFNVQGWDLVLASDTYRSAEAEHEAELLMRQAILASPDSADTWTAWGRFNLRRSQYDLAIEALQHALKLQGYDHVGYSTPRFLLGRLYHEQERPDLAKPLLEEATARDDFAANADRGAAFRHLGLLYRKQGDEAKAQELVQLAAKYTVDPELE